MRPAWKKAGLLSSDKLRRLLQKFLGDLDLTALKIPLIVNAVNIKSGRSHYFESGPLPDILAAASAVPLLFNPVEIDGELYMDGGVVNNLPVEPVRERADYIVGVHSNPVDPEFMLRGIRSIMERTLILVSNANVESRMNQCDYLIEPPEMCSVRAFEHKRAKEIFEIGDHYAKQAWADIRNLADT
jgi:NTE family protein